MFAIPPSTWFLLCVWLVSPCRLLVPCYNGVPILYCPGPKAGVTHRHTSEFLALHLVWGPHHCAQTNCWVWMNTDNSLACTAAAPECASVLGPHLFCLTAQVLCLDPASLASPTMFPQAHIQALSKSTCLQGNVVLI